MIPTLWPIDDEASGALMVSAYRALRTDMAVAEALRQAQIEALRRDEKNSLYYWAAFALTGDYLGRGE